MGTSRQDVLATAAQPVVREGWEAIPRDPAVKKAVSARIAEPDAQWVINEAVDKGVTPSALIADLVAEAIQARKAADGSIRLVPVDKLHEAIDRLAQAA